MNIARVILLAVAWAGATYATLAFAYYWDPTRMLWKRGVEADLYRFEAVDPRLNAIDPRPLIRARDPAQARTVRDELIRTAWPEGLPIDVRPVRVDVDVGAADAAAECQGGRDAKKLFRSLACAFGRYRDMANLAAIDRLWLPVGDAYRSAAALFRPIDGNGRLVVYQHGYAGTYHDHHRHIEALVGHGFAVMAHNLPTYGENTIEPEAGDLLGGDMAIAAFVQPVIVGLNYAQSVGYREAEMMGFSAGAWVTVVVAAVDPRVRRSYPVAGTLPWYLSNDRERPPPQRHPIFQGRELYLDLYTLGASGPGRRQMQVFNRFDRCCFNGLRGTLYETAVAEAVDALDRGGSFRVVIDETHARHKISSFAMAAILTDLTQ